MRVEGRTIIVRAPRRPMASVSTPVRTAPKKPPKRNRYTPTMAVPRERSRYGITDDVTATTLTKAAWERATPMA